jgi:hypothetical protein
MTIMTIAGSMLRGPQQGEQGGVLQVTNAPSVQALEGPVTQRGGSVTLGGIDVGVEAVLQKGVAGTNLSLGFGTPWFPVEMHGLAGYAWFLPEAWRLWK